MLGRHRGGSAPADGSFTFNREPVPRRRQHPVRSDVGLLAGLVVAAPLTGETIGPCWRRTALHRRGAAKIDDDLSEKWQA